MIFQAYEKYFSLILPNTPGFQKMTHKAKIGKREELKPRENDKRPPAARFISRPAKIIHPLENNLIRL